jgi:hypothetical protein
MSAAAVQSAPVPNFGKKLNLNLPKLPTFVPQQQVAQPVLPVLPALPPALLPVVQTPLAPVAQAVVTATQVLTESPAFHPVDFILDLSNVDLSKLENPSTQEQQYKAAGFSFKVPRVKTALTDATVDRNLTRTMDNIESARPNASGTKYTPLSHLSQEDRDIIARAQTEYNELVRSRGSEGTKQHEKELKAWNEMKDEKGNPVQAFTKILRDVFTLDFKTEDDVRRFTGDADKKTDGLIKAWTKEHKKAQDKLSIRSKRQGLRLTLEIVFNGTLGSQGATVSDELVASFNQLVQVNGAGVSCSYQRVTGEYKTKLVKDKKTGQLVPQDKKKPSTYVVDPIASMDQWKSALFMVNRLRNRFSDELHVAVTVFIDYLVKQFSQVAIIKCRASDKARVLVKHVLENTHQIELFPLISNFRSYQAAVLAQQAQPTKGKLKGTTVGDVPSEPTETVSKKKHPFEYCVFAVCKQLIKELKELNPNAGFDNILISSEYKTFMCEIVDELIQTFGPILRQEITSREVKTVNVDTFYSVLGALLTWHRVSFPAVKSYIEERVTRYDQYDEEETPETSAVAAH